jgi:two-component system, NtrC family, response regulator AtoC
MANEKLLEVSPQPATRLFLGMPAIIASQPMQRMMAMVERVARSSATVLITGESGSGKEIIARAVHHYSPRTSKPWVDLSCAALPEHLIESELFGYDRGAFSGADSNKPGLFELAHQGTIFLDEIGELEARMQVKLLRVLDGAPY